MEIVGGFSPARVGTKHYCLILKRRSLYSGYILMLLHLGCYGGHGEGEPWGCDVRETRYLRPLLGSTLASL